MKCLYLSAEDSSSSHLKPKIREMGGNEENIITVEMDRATRLRFNSAPLKRLIEREKPAICVFDPIQAFMPGKAVMSSRQSSREALGNLLALGQSYGTAFVLVCHTNKKRTDDWRQRMSGSADLPDIARSVLFTDYTEYAAGHAIRFLSNEKNNYGPLQETLLYRLHNGGLEMCGFSDKRFADFARDKPYEEQPVREKSQKDQAMEQLLEYLQEKGCECPVKEIDDFLKEAGFSTKTVATVKRELVDSGKAARYSREVDGRHCWFLTAPAAAS